MRPCHLNCKPTASQNDHSCPELGDHMSQNSKPRFSRASSRVHRGGKSNVGGSITSIVNRRKPPHSGDFLARDAGYTPPPKPTCEYEVVQTGAHDRFVLSIRLKPKKLPRLVFEVLSPTRRLIRRATLHWASPGGEVKLMLLDAWVIDDGVPASPRSIDRSVSCAVVAIAQDRI